MADQDYARFSFGLFAEETGTLLVGDFEVTVRNSLTGTVVARDPNPQQGEHSISRNNNDGTYTVEGSLPTGLYGVYTNSIPQPELQYQSHINEDDLERFYEMNDNATVGGQNADQQVLSAKQILTYLAEKADSDALDGKADAAHTHSFPSPQFDSDDFEQINDIWHIKQDFADESILQGSKRLNQNLELLQRAINDVTPAGGPRRTQIIVSDHNFQGTIGSRSYTSTSYSTHLYFSYWLPEWANQLVWYAGLQVVTTGDDGQIKFDSGLTNEGGASAVSHTQSTLNLTTDMQTVAIYLDISTLAKLTLRNGSLVIAVDNAGEEILVRWDTIILKEEFTYSGGTTTFYKIGPTG